MLRPGTLGRTGVTPSGICTRSYRCFPSGVMQPCSWTSNPHHQRQTLMVFCDLWSLNSYLTVILEIYNASRLNNYWIHILNHILNIQKFNINIKLLDVIVIGELSTSKGEVRSLASCTHMIDMVNIKYWKAFLFQILPLCSHKSISGSRFCSLLVQPSDSTVDNLLTLKYNF